MQLITIITFLIPVAVATHHHKTLLKTILKSKGNFFTKVNNDFQNVMNNLFASLDLSVNFLGKPRVQQLLTMHYDLKNIAEKNYDAYEKMNNITEVDRNQNTNKIELYDLIEEILNHKHLNLSGGIKEKPHYMHKHTKRKTKKNFTDSDFGDSKEFTNFIQAFVNKVDNLGIKDFTKKSPIFPILEKEDNSTEYNLEAWEPPPFSELDLFNDIENRRLFHGERVRILEFPFIASIHFMGVFACAGTIISADLIITAASCLQLLHNNRFFRENSRDLYVRIGSDYYVLGGETIDILEVYFHPSYDPKTLRNNLVILRLEKWIRFREKQKKARRILYDRVHANLAINTDRITALGWGSRKPNQLVEQFQILSVAHLDIYHLHECAEVYSKEFVTEKHFCAGFISKGGGACNKDLGGPGIVGGILVGVISFGSPVCGASDAPTVFTKVGFYAEWIESIEKMRKNVVAVGTTLLPEIGHNRPYATYSTHKSDPVVPIMKQHLRAQKTENPEDILEVKSILKELAQYNSSFLHNFLYPDDDEESFYDMFKPTEKMNPLHHPLANKTLFLIPAIHTIETTAKDNYVTIPLTTSPTKLPPPTVVQPTDYTERATRTPLTTEEHRLTNFLRAQTKVALRMVDDDDETYNSGNYDFMSTRAPMSSIEEAEIAPKSYSSYEDYNVIKKRHKQFDRLHRDKIYLRHATTPISETGDDKYIETNEVDYEIENTSDGDLDPSDYFESNRK